MKQLTIIVTIFLPLACLTGFFGQNLDWTGRQIGSWETFAAFRVGPTYFKRRGWF